MRRKVVLPLFGPQISSWKMWTSLSLRASQHETSRMIFKFPSTKHPQKLMQRFTNRTGDKLMLHPTHGSPPSMDSRLFHRWYVPPGYPTIHLIAAMLPPMGLLSMDGIFHLWTATPFIALFITATNTTSTTTTTTTTKYPAISTSLSLRIYRCTKPLILSLSTWSPA